MTTLLSRETPTLTPQQHQRHRQPPKSLPLTPRPHEVSLSIERRWRLSTQSQTSPVGVLPALRWRYRKHAARAVSTQQPFASQARPRPRGQRRRVAAAERSSACTMKSVALVAPSNEAQDQRLVRAVTACALCASCVFKDLPVGMGIPATDSH